MFEGNFPSVVLNKREIYWDSKALGHVTFNLIKVLSLKECKRNLLSPQKAKIQWELFEFSPQVRESGLLNRRNCEIREILILLVAKSGIFGFGIRNRLQLKESGISLTIGVLLTKSGIQYPESWIHGVKLRMQYVCLGLSIYIEIWFPYMCGKLE